MKNWSDRPVMIVASGPSLTDEDVALVKSYHFNKLVYVIVINDNWQLIPKADVLYAADHRWWTTNYAKVAGHFEGQPWTCDDRITNHYPRVRLIQSKVGSGLPESRDFIKVGASSTTQAIELAYIWGARTIGLLGLDCQSPDGRKHWFGNHPPCLDEPLPFERWIEELSILAKELFATKVEVINCSRKTALTCFPHMTLVNYLRQRT